MSKRISSGGKYYYYIWSFHNEDEANEKASRVRNLGYKTKVVKMEGRLGLYGLYTSPEYGTHRDSMSTVLE